MLLVLSKSFNPYINLATEEVLLKQKTEDIIMLWRSTPSVIVGKHQNANAEINHHYIAKNQLTVARRLSGGGTVVHDLQNLNFTYLSNAEEGKLINFKRFLTPIIKYLSTLGIDAHIGKTNDLRIGELKISGNAEHVYRKRVLHHGTLLFNSDLKQLGKAINVSPGRYHDKAVQSNRSSVTNIARHLHSPLTIEEFSENLLHFFIHEFKGSYYSLTQSEFDSIKNLANEKYLQENWIWGYSPKYTFTNTFNWQNEQWKAALKTEKGIITEFQLSNNNHNLNTSALLGQYHNLNTLVTFAETHIKLKTSTNETLNNFCSNLI